jgi:deoxyribodipyrimidine photo-lyase
LQQAGVVLGGTYPHPIVDHKAARARALAGYGEMKKAP